MVAKATRVPESLQTRRLTAERIGTHHYEALTALHADERVMATMGGCQSAGETAAFIAASDQHWTAEGFGMYALHVQPDDPPARPVFAGRAGLRRCVIDDAPEVEIAFALHAACWGKGYATEIAAALAQCAFNDLTLDEVLAFAIPHNTASRRVMEKIGMRYEREFTRHDLLHVLYRLPRESFNLPA